MFLRMMTKFLFRSLGSELTEPSQTSNEIEVISQRIDEQNNTKMTQIEEQLNWKIEEILKEIWTNKNNNLTTGKKDTQSNRPGPFAKKTNFSGENTHRVLKVTEIRIFTSSLQNWINWILVLQQNID